MRTIRHTADKEILRPLVIKFGGSEATDPETGEIKVDYFETFFQTFANSIIDRYTKIGLVIGGGQRARTVQQAAGNVSSERKDRLPKKVMLENAEVLRWMAANKGFDVVPIVPRNSEQAKRLAHHPRHNAVSLSWLKEGQSSDASAVFLLQEFIDALEVTNDPVEIEPLIVILSNVPFIYTADPHEDPQAKAISFASLPTLINARILSSNKEDFQSGQHVPIDSVAVGELLKLENQGHEPTVFYTGGDQSNFPSVREILLGEKFREDHPRVGTRIRSNTEKLLFYEGPIAYKKQPVR